LRRIKMAKMINADELIEFCNTERSMLHAHNNSVACAALRRVVEFAKEYAVEAEPVNGWISVKDRLPDDDVDVLLHDKYCGTLIGWYDKEDDVFKTDYISQLEAVTRWMPLPEEPKEE
jgi:hypothetical protein